MSYQSTSSSEPAYVSVSQHDRDHEADSSAVHDLDRSDREGVLTRPSKKAVVAFVSAMVFVCFVLAAATRYSGRSELATTATTTTSVAVASEDASLEANAKALKEAEAATAKVCANPDYSSQTLKLAHEMPVVALLGKQPGPVFETSCILNLGEYFYVVSDDSPGIGKIRTRLQYNDPSNSIIEPTKPLFDGPSEENGFEALFYDEDTKVFSAVIEAVPLKVAAANANEEATPKFHSLFFDFKMRENEDKYDIVATCPSNFEFSSQNKGFEGAALVKNSKGESFVLGLCEGNFCEGGKRGRERGNGRVVVLKRTGKLTLHGTDYSCGWLEQSVIELPKSLAFQDYSAITMYGSDPTNLRVAIASQENAQVWIGHFNADTLTFLTEGEHVYDFPRDGDCQIVYCNVEGLDFLSDNLLVAASDQMKNAARQPARCLAKDQSVHVFVIP